MNHVDWLPDAIRHLSLAFACSSGLVRRPSRLVAPVKQFAVIRGAVNGDLRYVEWYAGLMRLVEAHHSLPIVYADDFDNEPGWEIGWGSGIRRPNL